MQTVFQRHPGFPLSRAKRTDRDLCGKLTSCNHLGQGEIRLKGGGGSRDCRRAVPGELGDWCSPRGRGSGRRVAQAGPDVQAARPPPAGPGGREPSGRCRLRQQPEPPRPRFSGRPAPAARGNRSRGRAHTHPAPPWKPSASATAAGLPSTAAAKKTASGSSCRSSQLLPSVRPRPSPAARRRPRIASRFPGRRASARCQAVAGEDAAAGGGACGRMRGGEGGDLARAEPAGAADRGGDAAGMRQPGERSAPGSSQVNALVFPPSFRRC